MSGVGGRLHACSARLQANALDTAREHGVNCTVSHLREHRHTTPMFPHFTNTHAALHGNVPVHTTPTSHRTIRQTAHHTHAMCMQVDTQRNSHARCRFCAMTKPSCIVFGTELHAGVVSWLPLDRGLHNRVGRTAHNCKPVSRTRRSGSSAPELEGARGSGQKRQGGAFTTGELDQGGIHF